VMRMNDGRCRIHYRRKYREWWGIWQNKVKIRIYIAVDRTLCKNKSYVYKITFFRPTLAWLLSLIYNIEYFSPCHCS
jgi:hypothetical protein